METFTYTLVAFLLIALGCTVLSVLCKTDLSDLLPVYKPKKKEKAAYWGEYKAEPKSEKPARLPL